MIAALYVQQGGCYYGLPDVDPWPEERDARTYAGPWPVVAHPPCQRWGKYWYGGPSAKVRRVKGDDGGCFAAALASVRRWGGVLEHPAYSAAWEHFGLQRPTKDGGWIVADEHGGQTCHVEWDLPSLHWGPSAATVRLDAGFHSVAERAFWRLSKGADADCRERMSQRECAATPIPFRNLLLAIARCVEIQKGAAE